MLKKIPEGIKLQILINGRRTTCVNTVYRQRINELMNNI